MRYLLVVAVSTLTVAGCAGTDRPHVATELTGTAGSSSAEPVVATVADPCVGAPAGCTLVGEVDVDGDGGLDKVGVVVERQPPPASNIAYGPATVTVRIATESGVRELRVDNPSGNLPANGTPTDVFVGAYPISRPAGADLVLHTAYGAGNSDQFSVIGWQGSSPVRVPRPPASPGNFLDADVWYLQESEGTQQTVTCPGGATVTLDTLSAPEAEGIPLPGGGLRESDKWTFANGAWSPQGSENVADNDFSYQFDAHTDAFKCADQRRSQ